MTSLHDRTARVREAVVPGWLAEAMPEWLTEAVRPKPAPVPWGAMVRAALAICVPLSVGIVAGRRDIGLMLAIGGLLGTVIDTGGPYVVRVERVIIAAVFGGAAGLVIGTFIHHRGWIAVVSLVVMAGVSALISRLGSTGSVTGLQLLMYATLGLGPFGALRPWWHVALGFLAGVAWALLLLVPGWLLSPRSAEQSSVADVYHALADDLRAIGTDRTAQTRRAVTAALNTAYDTLLTARATAGGRSRRMMHLMTVLNASSRAPAAALRLGGTHRRHRAEARQRLGVHPRRAARHRHGRRRGTGRRHPGGGPVRAVAAVPHRRAGGRAAIRPPPQLRPGGHLPGSDGHIADRPAGARRLAARRRTAGRHPARLRDRPARRVRALAGQLALAPATAVRGYAAWRLPVHGGGARPGSKCGSGGSRSPMAAASHGLPRPR